MQPGMYPQGAYPPPPQGGRGMPWWGWVLIVLFVGPCFLGIAAAVSIPMFVRYMRRAKTSEAVDHLAMLCRATNTYAASGGAPLASAPMTPPQVPSGVRVIDAPDTWSVPTWQALGFALRDPHYYSYEYVAQGNTFAVRAYGDLDNNGVLSTFERQGTITPGNSAMCGPLSRTREFE